MPKQETDQTTSKRKNLILSFVIPFVAVMAIWTIWDYCDISDSVDHEREAGIKYDVTDQQIFLNSFKDSFVFAIPAGLIGLGCGFAVFGTDAKIDSAPEQ
jgi:hypothetical protein